MSEAEELADIKLEDILTAMAKPGGGAELTRKIRNVARQAMGRSPGSAVEIEEFSQNEVTRVDYVDGEIVGSDGNGNPVVRMKWKR